MPKKPGDYALYKNDELIVVGTMREIARFRGVKLNAVESLMCPSKQNRKKNKNKGLVLIRLED